MDKEVSTVKIFGIIAIISFLIWFGIEFLYVSGIKEGETRVEVIDTYTKFSIKGGEIRYAKIKLEDNSVVSAIIKGCFYVKGSYLRVSVYTTPLFGRKNYVVECNDTQKNNKWREVRK